MIWGLSTEAFTEFHVILSLVGIVTGRKEEQRPTKKPAIASKSLNEDYE